MLNLDIQIVCANLGADPEFFNLTALVLLARFLKLFLPLIAKFGEINELTNGRIVLSRNLYQV